MEPLHSGRVIELNRPPDVVNPLSLSIHPNGKKRLILDLCYINNLTYLNMKSSTKIGDCLILFPKGFFYDNS